MTRPLRENREAVKLKQSMDAIDLLILETLQREARITNRRLSERVGLSPSACLERVRRLEQSGVITGYSATIGAAAFPIWFEAWAHISLRRPSQVLQDRLSAQLSACAYVVAAYELAGQIDMLVHVVAPDAETWRAFVRSLEAKFEGGIRTAPVMRVIKPPSPLPLALLWRKDGASPVG